MRVILVYCCATTVSHPTNIDSPLFLSSIIVSLTNQRQSTGRRAMVQSSQKRCVKTKQHYHRILNSTSDLTLGYLWVGYGGMDTH